jgi:hypothetical protein
VWDDLSVSPLIPGGLFPNGKLPLTPADWINTADHLSRSPTRLLVDLIEGVAAQVADEDLHIVTSGTDVALRLADLRIDHPDPRPFLGSLDPSRQAIDLVELDVSDVRWTDDQGRHRRIDRVDVAVRRAWVDPGRRLTLVCGPIDAVAVLHPDTVDEWVAHSELDYDLHLGGPGLVEARPRGGGWWNARVQPVVDGQIIRFPVTRVGAFGFEVPVPPRWQGERSAELPHLARGAYITAVDLDADALRVHVRIDELREPIALEHLQRALVRAGSHLVLRVADPRS